MISCQKGIQNGPELSWVELWRFHKSLRFQIVTIKLWRFLKSWRFWVKIVTILSKSLQFLSKSLRFFNCKTVQLTIDNLVTISKILTILWRFFKKYGDNLVTILVKWLRFLQNPYNFVMIFRDKFVTILQNRDDFRKSLRFFKKI